MTYFLPNPGPLRPNFQRDRFVVVPHALPASLVSHWRQHAQSLKGIARTITRQEAGFELIYRVVTGDDIRTHWPELFAFYNDGHVLDWFKQVTGDNTVHTSPHIQSAVNLNILDSANFLYRWHFDAVCYTALLYLTDVLPEDGGALKLIPNCQQHVPPDLAAAAITQIWPRAGTMVVMDGTRCYHSVAPMLRDVLRLSVPLVFPNSETTTRPPGLDSYLYDRTG